MGSPATLISAFNEPAVASFGKDVAGAHQQQGVPVLWVRGALSACSWVSSGNRSITPLFSKSPPGRKILAVTVAANHAHVTEQTHFILETLPSGVNQSHRRA